MIAHLSGTLTERSPTRAVIDVGGVGYAAAVSLATHQRLPAVGQPARLLTHTYVREDRLELYGFADGDELAMFEMLIGVSGIGPNSALVILSGMSVHELREAILRGRPDELDRVRGVGPKTAQRIIIELCDRVRALLPGGGTPAEPSGEPGIVEEAAMALVALGIASAQARKAVASARKRAGADASLEALIKQALQER
ncbi:MAG: Holliday junction branch migration protein RuvA [Gemmatimonadota bacterium]